MVSFGIVYLDESAVSLIAPLEGLGASVGAVTSCMGEIVTTLLGGVVDLGLGLRGDADLLLDLLPGFGLLS